MIYMKCQALFSLKDEKKKKKKNDKKQNQNGDCISNPRLSNA